jgi:hypothetical protein
LTRDGHSKRLLQGRQNRCRECALDASSVERKNPEGDAVGHPPPDEWKARKLIADDSDNTVDILLKS